MKVADWKLPSSPYADRSSSTAPMPCATPPRIWPSTTAGLISAPQSSTATYRSTFTMPVSTSTSTIAQWVPPDQPPSPPSYVASTSSRASTPSPNESGPEAARRATSLTGIAVAGSPRTQTLPSVITRSRALTSMRTEAKSSTLALSCRAPCSVTPPVIVADRLPPVSPNGTTALSPTTTRTWENGTPNSSAAICASVV